MDWDDKELDWRKTSWKLFALKLNMALQLGGAFLVIGPGIFHELMSFIRS